MLYSTHLALDVDRKLKRSQVARKIAIKESTLNLYLSKLSSSGLIERRKMKNRSDEFNQIDLTCGGHKRISEIIDRIDELNFTPERHNIDRVVSLKRVLGQLKHPLDKIQLLSLYSRQSYFNLPKVINAMAASHDETNIVNVLSNLNMEKGEREKECFTDVYARCSLYGDNGKNDMDYRDLNGNDIDSLLFLAESERKHGEINRAKEDFQTILEHCRNLSQHQWVIASINLIYIKHLNGDSERALSAIDSMMGETKEKVYLSYLKMVKAFIFSQMEEYDDAMKLFNSSVRSFRRLDQQLLLALALNNRGVLHFKTGHLDRAVRDWNKALLTARLIPSSNIEGMVLVNLADLEMKKGKLSKAEGMLDRAQEVFWELGDFEKISCLYFNRALLSLERGDLAMMVEHMRNSEEVAYPLPSFYEKMERRKEIIKRGREKGIKDPSAYLSD